MVEEGETFGDFLLEERISTTGGMGVVYRAMDLALRRECALKFIKEEHARDEGFRRRFTDEAQILARFKHRNVLPVFAAGERDGVLFIATQFVRDGDLNRVICSNRLEPNRILAILEQMAAGLEAVHAAKIIHRDIKPGNVLVEREGDGERVYLADFGIAKAVDRAPRTRNATPTLFGSHGYTAPECELGREADERADVYSLGSCLFAMLEGSPAAPRLKQAPEVRESAGRSRALRRVREVIQRSRMPAPGDRQSSPMELYYEAEAALRELSPGMSPGTEASDALTAVEEETRLDTPSAQVPGVLRGASLDDVLRRLGLDALVDCYSIARDRIDPSHITVVFECSHLPSLRKRETDLARDIAAALDAGSVRLVFLPRGMSPEEVASCFLGAVLGDRVRADELAHLRARVTGDSLELRVSPAVDRHCDEATLTPLVAHLGVKQVQIVPLDLVQSQTEMEK